MAPDVFTVEFFEEADDRRPVQHWVDNEQRLHRAGNRAAFPSNGREL
jgi:hypothetical protein